jgi:CubicO group peptidase (beta-lactamase class C family)
MALQGVEEPGCVSLVRRGDGADHVTVSGLADAEAQRPVSLGTRFQIASVSKLWVATVFGVLYEAGRLDWDDPVARWFPTLPYGGAVSVHHLLTHTSGLGHWDAVGDWQTFADAGEEDRIALLARSALQSQPGRAWSYSGPGYALLGLIAAATEQEPYPAIVERAVIARLGLGETTCGLPGEPGADVALGDHGRDREFPPSLATLPGTGDIWSTAGDLAAFATACRRGQLLQPLTMQVMVDRAVELGQRAFSSGSISGSRYGYGRNLGSLAGRSAWFHSGDNPGFQSFLGEIVDSATTVVVLTNADHPPVSEYVHQALQAAGLC